MLAPLHGTEWIMARLQSCAGLRLMECLLLRVKGINFARNEILVRAGNGDRDCVALLPAAMRNHFAPSRIDRTAAQGSHSNGYDGIIYMNPPRSGQSKKRCGKEGSPTDQLSHPPAFVSDHLLEFRYDIQTAQECLKRRDHSATTIHTHALD